MFRISMTLNLHRVSLLKQKRAKFFLIFVILSDQARMVEACHDIDHE